MKQENINIVKCDQQLKVIKITFMNRKEGRLYETSEEEFPHPDLINAIKALYIDLGRSFYSTQKGLDNYKPSGFVLDERDDKVTVEISGKLENVHEYIVSVKSGKIPFEGKVEERIDKVRQELFLYFFENKTAQLEIPYNERAEKDDDGADQTGE